jgi:Gram-negative bacterial TonB protein C-terminal
MASGTISVARILQLRVPIAWQEAVEVASAADKLAGTDSGGITLAGCVLSEDGTVTLAQVPAATRMSALQLLGRMLQGQAAPPELRALVMSAEDGLDSFPSEQDTKPRAKELSLDWFLRPHPAIEIAKLASRALAAESAEKQSTALQKLRTEVLEHRHKPEPPKPKAPPPVPSVDWGDQLLAYWRANWPPRRETLVVAAALVAAFGAVALLWTGLSRAWSAGPEPIRGVPQTQWVEAAAPATSWRVKPVSAGLLAAGAAADVRVPRGTAGTSAELPRNLSGRVEAGASRPANDRPTMVVDADGAVVRTRELQVVFPTEPPDARPVVPAAASRAPAAAAANASGVGLAPERRIYSAEDAGVAPPEMIRPQLPSERKADTEPSDSWVEVVVDERGQVAQVRLHSTDASLSDRMLVAAAKAWQFQPARKDGRPVKYVLRLPVTY